MKHPFFPAPQQDITAVVTAASLGLEACPHCATVWRDAKDGEACGICGTRLHTRKPDSLNRTWALLIAACILYIPANLLPIMVTKSFFGTQQDTILSGVIYFWVSGAFGLAAIVFIASFLVPLFKLTVLMLLLISVQRRSTWRQPERVKLYRMLETIGRWSMLDVFVVSLLTGLVQIQGFAQVTAGVGIATFGGVVVLTMLASLTFDPKLIWDTTDPQAPAATNAPSEPTVEKKLHA